MFKWINLGVLGLSLVIGSCTPNSSGESQQDELEMQAHRLFTAYIDNGLAAANRGIMTLERESNEAANESDTLARNAVSMLRSQYEEISVVADSLAESDETALEGERLALRDRLLDLTETVEKTRFEIIEESEQFREEAKRRLAELDKRMFALTGDVNEAGLEKTFDPMITRLELLREDAVAEVNEMDEASTEEFTELRSVVANSLSQLSARLTEAETEFQTAVDSGTGYGDVSSGSQENPMPSGQAAAEPIDPSQ